MQTDEIEIATEEEARSILGGSRPIHRSTLWRYVKAGIVPKPIKIGGQNRWVVAELRDVHRRAMATRDGQAA